MPQHSAPHLRGYGATGRFGLLLISLLQFSVAWPGSARMFLMADVPCGSMVASGTTRDTQNEQSLELGTVIGREIRGGETHRYVFRIAADHFARLVVEQQGIDVAIRISDGEDRPVVVADRPNGMRGPEAVSVIAPLTGSYHVSVAPVGSAPPGRYEIRLKELRPAGLDDARRIFAERLVYDGETLRDKGSADTVKQAILKFKQAVQEWDALGEKYEQGVALYGLAWSYYAQGEFQEAARWFESALLIMTELDDVYARAIDSVGLAFSHFNLGEYQGALSYFRQALEFHRRLGNKRGEAIALYGTGWVYALLGDDDKALDTFLKVLPLRRAIPDPRGEARTLSSIGDMDRRLGKYQEALTYLDAALQILRDNNDHYAEANTLASIAWTRSSLGQYDRSLASFNDALRLRREVGDRAGEATTLYGIARTLDKQSDPLGARDRIESALSIIESLRASGTSQDLRTDYFALVQDYYQFYIDLLMRLHSRNPTAGYDALALQGSERARCRTLLDLLGEAQSGIRRGVDPFLLERANAVRRELNSANARYRELLTRNFGPTAAKEIETLTSQHQEVERLTRRYEQLESQILSASPKYAEQTQAHILSAEEIQRQLDEDTLLLEYSLGAERSYLWAVTRGSIQSYELPSRARIEAATGEVSRIATARAGRGLRETDTQWRARVKRADADYWKAAASLSAMLLAPLQSQPFVRRLVIVPQGALQSVPFAALPTPPARSPPNPSGTPRVRRLAQQGPKAEEERPLILDHEVVVLPSASTLPLLRRDWPDRKAPAKTVAILADPVFSANDERVHALPNRSRASADIAARDMNTGAMVGPRAGRLERVATGAPPARDRSELPRLFATRTEADAIMTMVRGNDGLEAIDFKANRALATSGELSDYRILHFATHALIDNQHPELSAIALSAVNERGEAQDGFLRAHEIFNLKLSADLVVLSGCRTGTGKEVAGEGLLGLTRPFMYAGAPRVIVSLWPVDDRATAELMSRFYRRLLGGARPSPSAALRQAKIEMWRDPRWHSPYFWGGIVLQGEWR